MNTYFKKNNVRIGNELENKLIKEYTEYFIKVNQVIDLQILEYMKINKTNEEEMKLNGRCEIQLGFFRNESYFYKDDLICSVNGSIISRGFKLARE